MSNETKASARAWSVPVWLALPAVGALWLSSWIATLDPTASFEQSYLVWGVTAVATAALATRLVRAA